MTPIRDNCPNLPPNSPAEMNAFTIPARMKLSSAYGSLNH
jgi:hypothetical protein